MCTIPIARISDPIAIANAGDGSNRLYVSSKQGQLYMMEASGEMQEQPVLDLSYKTTFNQYVS